MSAAAALVALSLGCAKASASETAQVRVSIEIAPIAEIKFPDDFDFYIRVTDDKHDGVEPVVLPFKIRGNAHASITVIPDAFLKVYRGPWLGKARWVSSGGHGHDDDDHDHHDHDHDDHDHDDDHDHHGGGHGGHDDDRHDDGHRGGRGNDRDDHDRDGHKNTKGKGHDEHGNGNGYGHDHDHDHDNGPTTLGYNAIVRFPVTSSNDARVPNYNGFGTGIFGNRLSSLPGQNGLGTPTLTANVAGFEHGRAGLIFIVSERDWTTNGKKARPGKYRGMLEVTVTADD
jgi:hypothetical protein